MKNKMLLIGMLGFMVAGCAVASENEKNGDKIKAEYYFNLALQKEKYFMPPKDDPRFALRNR